MENVVCSRSTWQRCSPRVQLHHQHTPNSKPSPQATCHWPYKSCNGFSWHCWAGWGKQCPCFHTSLLCWSSKTVLQLHPHSPELFVTRLTLIFLRGAGSGCFSLSLCHLQRSVLSKVWPFLALFSLGSHAWVGAGLPPSHPLWWQEGISRYQITAPDTDHHFCAGLHKYYTLMFS